MTVTSMKAEDSAAMVEIGGSRRIRSCHAAETIKHLAFDNVRTRPLGEIWYDGSAFNAFRGDGWMPELCKSYERKDIDFGGCRCQAMALVGDASATDPVCLKSPHRRTVDRRVSSRPLLRSAIAEDIKLDAGARSRAVGAGQSRGG